MGILLGTQIAYLNVSAKNGHLQCKLILCYLVKVINHDIELSLLESIEKLAKEFFMLPLEEKQKYPMIPGTLQGYGQKLVSLKILCNK